MGLWVKARCENHFAPILPEYTSPLPHWDWDLDAGRCICGREVEGDEISRAQDNFSAAWVNKKSEDEFFRKTHDEINSPGKLKDPEHGEKDPSARWYLITLTQPDTIHTPEHVLKNARKVVMSKQIDPITWSYCLELTQSGTPHTHAIVYTKKYFDYDKIRKFNRSPEGVQWRVDIQSEKWNVTKYPMKHETKPTPEWLAAHGLTEFVWYADNFPPELKYQEQV